MSEGIEWLKGLLEKEDEWIYCSQDDPAIQDEDIEYLCSRNTRHLKMLSLSNSFLMQIIASLLLQACCIFQRPIGTTSLRYNLVLIMLCSLKQFWCFGMQVSYPSIDAESIDTKFKYYLHNKACNLLGGEGASHLSKAEWRKIKYI
jgi:hypothetical protein